jgi:hypothetical protein
MRINKRIGVGFIFGFCSNFQYKGSGTMYIIGLAYLRSVLVLGNDTLNFTVLIKKRTSTSFTTISAIG